MHRIRLRLPVVMAIVTVFGLALLAPLNHVSAASNSLGVNPRRDYTIKAGDKVSGTLSVSNLSKTDDLVINIDVIDFGAKNETAWWPTRSRRWLRPIWTRLT